jgi:two-component system invasion response regulator UvrY
MRQAAKRQQRAKYEDEPRAGKSAILIAAAHAIARSGLRHILQHAGAFSLIAEAANTKQALTEALRIRPAVALIDIGLPPAGGLEALRQLLERDACSAIIVIAPSGDSDLAIRALDAGAIGFLTEGCGTRDIAEAVCRVAEGKPFLEPALLQEVALRRISVRRDPIVSLSPREYEIFRMLASGRSVSEVAQALVLSPRSVANYQTQIKRKLGVGTSAELVHLAIRRGVIQVGQP